MPVFCAQHDTPVTHATCPLCHKSLGAPLYKEILRKKRDYHIFFCTDCQTGFTIPLPSPEEWSQLYISDQYRTDGGKRFIGPIEWVVSFFTRLRMRRIEQSAEKGRMLDIGCGRGLLLFLMKRADWDVFGIEVNDEVASCAAETYGIPVISGDSSSWKFSERSFDVITLIHVLEHIQEPEQTLRVCGKLLKTGGSLVIAVPNLLSLQAQAGKDKWFHLDVPYHLYHFTEKGLVRRLEQSHYRIRKIYRFDMEQNPFGWLQTLLNLSGLTHNYFYDLLKAPKLKREELLVSGRRDIMLTVLLLPLYLPLALVLSLFESFVMRKAGTIEIHAVKE